jgi:hypothetical protein
MSEFKGTKDEWFIPIGQVLTGFRKVSTNEKTICTLVATDFDSDKEFESNALLISKAPEMLDMLNKIAPTLERYGEIEQHKEVIELIKEATEL